jgi:[ribosomal protein S18]-alanine N-acetyltransferase
MGCKAKPEHSKAPGYNGGVEFTLRDFRPQDFKILWDIDQLCFAPGIAYSQRELATYIRRRGSFTIVAEQAGGPVHGLGTVAGFIVAEAAREVGHIISIDVLPNSRRLGLGSQLLVAAENRLRSLECRTTVLETAVDNSSALAFYKRHQYVVLRVYPRYYSNGVDAFVMGKNLNSRAQVLTRMG